MMVNVLITGANGFIGKNLQLALRERGCNVVTFGHQDDIHSLPEKVAVANVIYHLAGVNRPESEDEFTRGNTDFTAKLIEIILAKNSRVSLIYTSSSQAVKENPYGQSKSKAEKIILNAANSSSIKAFIYRLPGVFGKWCRPDYNSVVATFCYYTVQGRELRIDNPELNLELAYIDDVIEEFVQHLHVNSQGTGYCDIAVKYNITLKQLAETISGFKQSRETLVTDAVGQGLIRALYATYLSYLPAEQFSYSVPSYEDQRGSFSELLKTPAHGQFSFFTAKPGVTRGGHYHHTKNEKFIIVSGRALFRFEHVITREVVEFEISASKVQVVETIPGWAHNIKNIGSDDLIVMLWANEIFDRSKPDTISWSM